MKNLDFIVLLIFLLKDKKKGIKFFELQTK